MSRNGFTLVELMIVIAVIGLLSGAVIFTVGPPGGGPGESAARFAGRLAAARDQAILTGQPISAWTSPSGYGFDRFRDGHWEAMSDKPFDTENWAKGTDVAAAAPPGGRARVRFDSLGMADQPFEVRVSRGGQAARVRVDANGDVSVE
ncbi:MAG: GspH/FimT family pseudopilin [Alphaproteobacteria bacterium]